MLISRSFILAYIQIWVKITSPRNAVNNIQGLLQDYLIAVFYEHFSLNDRRLENEWKALTIGKMSCYIGFETSWDSEVSNFEIYLA